MCKGGGEGGGGQRGGPPGAEKGRGACDCKARCGGMAGEALSGGGRAGGAKKARARKLQVLFLASFGSP